VSDCGAYTYIGAGGDQYVACDRGCKRAQEPIACSDAVGAFKLVEYLRFDCSIVERPVPTSQCDPFSSGVPKCESCLKAAWKERR
jgi:hypothetical protein